MNKIYKVVWSKVKNCYVVVSELAKNIITGGVKSAKVGHAPMAKGLALGAAMAFVITGNALAATNYIDGIYKDQSVIESTQHAYGPFSANGEVVVKNSIFEGNSVHQDTSGKYSYGGALYVVGDLTVEGSKFINNNAHGVSNSTTHGGAITQQDGTLTIGGTLFDGNSVSNDKVPYSDSLGSAIYSNNAVVEISDSIFVNQEGGRAVYIRGDKGATFSGNIFANNARGCVQSEDPNTVLYFEGINTFTNNEGTILKNKGTANFKDGSVTIFSGNENDVENTGTINIGKDATVAFKSFVEEAGAINLNGGTLALGTEATIEELGGDGGSIAVLGDMLGKADAIVIENNGSTGDVVVKAREVDLSNGAKETLTNIEKQLKIAVTGDVDGLTFKGNVAEQSSLYGDVELTSAGKVITTMDTDTLIAREDVKAGDVSLVETAQGVKDNADAIAAEAEARANEDRALSGRIEDNADAIEGLDERVTANESAITAETSERVAADALLKGAIDAETSERVAADALLKGAIDAETSERMEADALLKEAVETGYQAADAVLADAIAKETNERLAADALLKDAIDAETQERMEADAALKAGYEAADKVLADAITAETNERVAADAMLKDAIDAETSERVAADALLKDAIDAETSERVAADALLKDAIDAETSERVAADALLKDAIDAATNERMEADALLKDAIDAETSERVAADALLKDAIDAETSERVAADALLKDAITAETNERMEADAVLAGAITAETNERMEADAALKAGYEAADAILADAITAETNERMVADAVLAGAITAETNERVAADALLKGAIDAETSERVAADAMLKDAIDAETSERMEADAMLKEAIDAEVERAQDAEEKLQDNIDTEAQARQVADTALNNRITDEVNRLDNRIDKVDAKIDKVGAMAAAMASLKTMGYDPEAPTEIAVGIGQYRDETGIAIGAFHYPNKDFMLNFSLSTAGDEVMGGIGATWKIGRKKPAGETMEDKVAKAEAMKEAAKAARVKAQQAKHAKMLAEKSK